MEMFNIPNSIIPTILVVLVAVVEAGDMVLNHGTR